jgi:hypothetical protein
MPDPVIRKRLKKKMLDRWENEGGKIATEPPGADDTKLMSEQQVEKQLSASKDISQIGARATPTKTHKRKRS